LKTKQALHIAEHLWDDTVSNGSLFDNMMKLGPTMQTLQIQGKTKEMEEIINEQKSEIVARWANIILESEEHVGGNL
jgi:hypothetical protein